MHIKRKDIEEKRTPSELKKFVNDLFQRDGKYAFSDENFWKRKGEVTKLVIEELYPFSTYFYKYYKSSHYFGSLSKKGEKSDALIYKKNELIESIQIVQACTDYEDALRREMVIKKGWSPSMGNIERKGKEEFKINAKAVTSDEHVFETVEKIILAYDKKINKNYINIDSLLINVEQSLNFFSGIDVNDGILNGFKNYVDKHGKSTFKNIILVISNDFCNKF